MAVPTLLSATLLPTGELELLYDEELQVDLEIYAGALLTSAADNFGATAPTFTPTVFNDTSTGILFAVTNPYADIVFHELVTYTLSVDTIVGITSVSTGDTVPAFSDVTLDLNGQGSYYQLAAPTPIAFTKENRPQPTRVACAYDSSKGQDELDLVDAYYEARGLEKFYFPVDFGAMYGAFLYRTETTPANTNNMWETFGEAFHDYCMDNRIQAVCISPNCPNLYFSIEGGGHRVEITAFFGYIYQYGRYLKDDGKHRYKGHNVPVTSSSVSSAVLDSLFGWYGTTDFRRTRLGHDVTVGSTLFTLTAAGTPSWTDKELVADLRTVGYFDKGVAGHLLSDGLSQEQLIWPGVPTVDDQYPNLNNIPFQATTGAIPPDLRFDGFRDNRIYAMPHWRIGYPDWANNNHSITPAVVTQMVENAIALENTLEYHAANSTIILESGRRNNIEATASIVATEITIDATNWQNVVYGIHQGSSGTPLSVCLRGASVSDGSIVDWDITRSRMEKYRWESTITDNPFVDFTLTNTVLEDVLPETTTARAFEYSGTDHYQYEAHGGMTFPLVPAIAVFSTCSNYPFNTDDTPHDDTNTGAIFDWSQGGLFVGESSHRHRDTPAAFDQGLSAAWGSFSEPGAAPVGAMPTPWYHMLRGHCVATAFLFRANTVRQPSLWGDGLFQPFADQADRPPFTNL